MASICTLDKLLRCGRNSTWSLGLGLPFCGAGDPASLLNHTTSFPSCPDLSPPNFVCIPGLQLGQAWCWPCLEWSHLRWPRPGLTDIQNVEMGSLLSESRTSPPKPRHSGSGLRVCPHLGVSRLFSVLVEDRKDFPPAQSSFPPSPPTPPSLAPRPQAGGYQLQQAQLPQCCQRTCGKCQVNTCGLNLRDRHRGAH